MVRDVLSQFRNRVLSATEAAGRLGLSRSGFYKLYTKYLASSAAKMPARSSPVFPEADRAAPWPKEVTDSLRLWLAATPPYSFRLRGQRGVEAVSASASTAPRSGSGRCARAS
jgi:hypothetical protein